MYESFYGLKEKPFSMLPDPSYLYLSKQHDMAITLLEYSLENQAGFCVITGRAGTGKTTLLRRLLHQMGNDVSVGLITNTHHSFGELMRWILLAFDIDEGNKSRAERHQAFVNYLIAQYAKNRRAMLIIDEAQNMSADALEELRMLSNINSEKDLLLQVILVGQPPLRDILLRPDLEQFAQRVAVDFHLESLDRDEMQSYINHRIKIAGGERDLFTSDAYDAIFEHSGGTPRLINLLCDTALVYAYAEQVAVVTGDIVRQVVRERENHGALPVFSKDTHFRPGLPRTATTARPTSPSGSNKPAQATAVNPGAMATPPAQAATTPVSVPVTPNKSAPGPEASAQNIKPTAIAAEPSAADSTSTETSAAAGIIPVETPVAMTQIEKKYGNDTSETRSSPVSAQPPQPAQSEPKPDIRMTVEAPADTASIVENVAPVVSPVVTAVDKTTTTTHAEFETSESRRPPISDQPTVLAAGNTPEISAQIPAAAISPEISPAISVTVDPAENSTAAANPAMTLLSAAVHATIEHDGSTEAKETQHSSAPEQRSTVEMAVNVSPAAISAAEPVAENTAHVETKQVNAREELPTTPTVHHAAAVKPEIPTEPAHATPPLSSKPENVLADRIIPVAHSSKRTTGMSLTWRQITAAITISLLLSAAVGAWLLLGQKPEDSSVKPELTLQEHTVVETPPVVELVPEPAAPVKKATPNIQQNKPLEKTVVTPKAKTAPVIVKKDLLLEKKLKRIQEERDAAMVKAAAAEREREALRAAAIAREQALAQEREKAARLAKEAEKAAQEAKAARALADEKARQETQQAAKPTAVAPETKAPAKAAVSKPKQLFPEPTKFTVPADAKPAGQAQSTDAGTSEPTSFTTNPCKGPSARFLSTCQ